MQSLDRAKFIERVGNLYDNRSVGDRVEIRFKIEWHHLLALGLKLATCRELGL